MKLLNLPVWSCATFLFLVGCGGGGGGGGGVTVGDPDAGADTDNQGTPPAPWTNVAWTTTAVEPSTPDKPRGDLGNLVAASDGTLYYAYLANNGASGQCTGLAIVSGTTQAPGTDYDVKIAVQAAGATSFGTPERLPVENAPEGGDGKPTYNFVGGRVGLDSAIMPNGHLLVATPGGSNGQFTCAVANLLLGERTGAAAYTMSRATTGSKDWGPFCAAGVTDDLSCCPDAGACTQGSDSGYYPSIAFDANNNYHIAYLDSHFVTDNDGKTHGDFEILNQTGTEYGGIDMWSGYGAFSTLRYKGDVGLVVTLGNLTGDIELFTNTNGGAWSLVANFSDGGSNQGRQRLEIAPNGNLGISYYQTTNSHAKTASDDLWYCEYAASDTTFSIPVCDRPETATLVAGQDVSLAFDSQSRPVMSYYYCGGGSCVHDGLRVTWHDSPLTTSTKTNKWWRFNAHNIDNDSKRFFDVHCSGPNHRGADDCLPRCHHRRSHGRLRKIQLMRAPLMVFALAMLASACGGYGNRLEGSISQSFSLAFDNDDVRIQDASLIVEYNQDER